MSIGTDLIEEALKQIGAHSIIAPADPESILIGRNKLNGMLQAWLTNDIDLGTVFIDAEGDEVGEPIDARSGIVDNLSIACAPMFASQNVRVTPELRTNARIGFNAIKAAYQVPTIPDKTVSSTLPRGQGNTFGRFMDNVYSGSGATLPSEDG